MIEDVTSAPPQPKIETKRRENPEQQNPEPQPPQPEEPQKPSNDGKDLAVA